MIKGIGIDLCSISRISTCLARPGFKERVFTDQELTYAKGCKNAPQHFAAAFAAKEAFAKAGGWGIGKTGLKNIWIERTSNGPVLFWKKQVNTFLEELGADKAHVSLSHEGDHAIALVILEGVQDVSL
jgi:holo-[acyl-carrier protein] synthase